MNISLRAGEKIYINGAVLRVDRKVSISLLNDAHFLLEAHVLQAADATTPMRQLYFLLQLMLMEPGGALEAKRLFEVFHSQMSLVLDTTILGDGLAEVGDLVKDLRYFEALKVIRALYPLEAQLQATPAPTKAA
jgi:flagellar biosynthesis repressor protein FlbT